MDDRNALERIPQHVWDELIAQKRAEESQSGLETAIALALALFFAFVIF